MLVTAFSPFPTMFSTHSNTNFNFSVSFFMSLANALNLDQSVKLMFGKVKLETFESNTAYGRLYPSKVVLISNLLNLRERRKASA